MFAFERTRRFAVVSLLLCIGIGTLALGTIIYQWLSHWESLDAVQFVLNPGNFAWNSILLSGILILGIRLFPKNRVLPTAILLLILASHLYWRLSETPVLTDFAESSLLIAEVIALFSLLLNVFFLCRPLKRVLPGFYLSQELWPSVDIIVLTSDEPLEVLYKTLIGALGVECPSKTVYLLDHSYRPDVHLLCMELKCEYRAIENTDKAGILNAVLSDLKGELLLLLDAGQIPSVNCLKRMVPCFFDRLKLAFIQSSQCFVSQDPFQRHCKQLGHEQDFWQHRVLPLMDGFDATLLMGSGAIFRRKALIQTGGFSRELETGIDTALNLHRSGWESQYINESLFSTIAPSTLGEYWNKRLRTTKSAIKLLLKKNTILDASLSLRQRLAYAVLLMSFIQPFLKQALFLLPIICLACGVFSVPVAGLGIIAHYLSCYLLYSLVYAHLSGNTRLPLWVDSYDVSFGCYAIAKLMENVCSLSRKNTHLPEKKLEPIKTVAFEWQAVWPQCVFLLITLSGLVYTGLTVLDKPSFSPALILLALWLGYNAWLLVMAVQVAMNRPERRQHIRVERQVDVFASIHEPFDNDALPENNGKWVFIPGRTINLSERGASIVLDSVIPVLDTLTLHLGDIALGLQSEIRVNVTRSLLLPDGRHQIHVLFLWDHLSVPESQMLRQKIIRHCFMAPNAWQGVQQAFPLLQGVILFILAPLRWCFTKETTSRRLAPRYQTDLRATIFIPSAYSGVPVQVLELSEAGAVIRITSRQSLPLMQSLQLTFVSPGTILGDTLTQVPILLLRPIRQLWPGDTCYSVSFPRVPAASMNTLREFLYCQPKPENVKAGFWQRIGGQSVKIVPVAKPILDVKNAWWKPRSYKAKINPEQTLKTYSPFGFEPKDIKHADSPN